MSIVSLQFGQCGNQIGHSLYTTLTEDIHSKESSRNLYDSLATNKWFEVNKHGKWEPRTILIDTESKVVQSSAQATNLLPFTLKNVVAKPYGGSANNWAYGYTTRGKCLQNEVINMVRNEVEKCDFLTSFLNIFSSSGGTGSGVGSLITEQLREEYPNKNIVNAVVLPYSKGEVVTQSYNSLLTLSHIYSLADSTVIFENDRLHYACKYTLNIEDISFASINTIIAQQLAAVYQPIDNIDSMSLFNNLTSHPSFKYLQIKSEPNIFKGNVKFEGSRQWKALVSSICKHSRFDFNYQKQIKCKNKTISNTLIARGPDLFSANDIKLIKEGSEYVTWLKGDRSFSIYHQKRNYLNFEKYLAIVFNSNSVCVPLNIVLNDAWGMFTHGAYLHHYKKYGIDEDVFLNSFQGLENVLDSYNSL